MRETKHLVEFYKGYKSLSFCEILKLMLKIVLPVYCSAGKIQLTLDPLLHVDIPRHLH